MCIRDRAEAWQKTTEQWAADVKADKEIGGDNLISNLSAAQRALDQFGTPELKEYLNTTGLGNHPDLVKTLDVYKRQEYWWFPCESNYISFISWM